MIKQIFSKIIIIGEEKLGLIRKDRHTKIVKDCEDKIEIHIQNEKHCQEKNQQLRQKLNELEKEINHRHWLGEKYEALEELKRMLENGSS